MKVIYLATIVNKLTGNEGGIIYKEQRFWDRKTKLVSAIVKAKKLLRYNPKNEFKKGLKATYYQWLLDNWDNIQVSAEF